MMQKTLFPAALFLVLLMGSSQFALAQQEGTKQEAADSCHITNIVPSFLSFWDEFAKADTATQTKIFQEKVIVPNQAVYDGVMSTVPIPLTTLIPQALAKVPEHIDAMRSMNQSITNEVPEHIKSFRKSFPDFQCSTPIYFLYSMGAFDGSVRKVNGSPALMFGVDVIAVTFGQNQDPLFAHELFHRYHNQVIQSQPDAIYWNLWEEGLATYVSRTLNPGLPDSKICCFPDIEAVKKQLPEIAGRLLGKLDSAKFEDVQEFFLGGQKALDIPERSGYYIGYLIAKQLGETRSLEQLAKLPPDEVKKLEEQELKRMKSRNG
jgi:hypothetical protein